MEKIIEVDGKQLKFKATAATPIHYKNIFGSDLLVDLTNITKSFEKNADTMPPETLEKFGQIAYVMNKQGDPEQPDNWLEWLDQFEIFSIVTVLPQILELWAMNTQTGSVQKKSHAR